LLFAVSMIAASLLSAVAPAFADGMTVTHVPSATPVQAGADLSLTAVVHDGCSDITGCNDPTLTLHYLDPAGIWQQVVATWSKTLVTNPVTVAVPSKDVRYPSLTYYFTSDQSRCFFGCTSYSGRAPDTGYYSVSVTNKVTFVATRNAGTVPLAGATWRLFLFDNNAHTQTELSTGATDATGSFTPSLDAATSILNAASYNDHFANFEVTVTKRESATVYTTAETFYANYGNTSSLAIPGASLTQSQGQSTAMREPIVLGCSDVIHVDAYNSSVRCDHGETCPTINESNDLGDQLDAIATSHQAYDMIATVSYGRTANSDFQTAIEAGFGPWTVGASHHVGNAQTQGYTNAQVLTVTAQPVSQVYGTWFTHWLYKHQEYDATSNFCDASATQKVETWSPTSPYEDRAPVAVMRAGDTSRDENYPGGDHATLYHNQSVVRTTQHNESITAAANYGAVSGSGTSGWGTTVTYTITSQTNCDHWYVYYNGGGSDLTNAPVVYSDAGDAGSGTTSGVPNGCTAL
jgi:hypothetical protein